MLSNVDFDLHGYVGIRLIDATHNEVTAVKRQLGPIDNPMDRDPDIIIRFVDALPTDSSLRLLDLDDVAYTDDAFYVLRGKHKSRTKVLIPFQDIGQRVEIVCERGLSAVPLLIDILNATALAKGLLPLHASAFNIGEVGVLATGWTKGGKTETLLGFMAHGANYVGDEWVYLTRDGQQMFGVPEPIRVWDWHLEYLPEYREMLGRGDRAKLRILKTFIQGTSQHSGNGSARNRLPSKMMGRIIPLLKRQMHVDWSPEDLFGRSSLSLAGKLDKVFFVVSHEAPHVVVEPIDPDEVARRMYFSLQEERDDFLSYYRKFRFAFPDRPNDFIEQTPELQRQHLTDALTGKEAYVVYHPYPVVIPDIYDAIRPLCTDSQACSLSQ